MGPQPSDWLDIRRMQLFRHHAGRERLPAPPPLLLMTALRSIAALALLAGSAAALGTNYEHDGRTVYCWAIPQPTNRTKLAEAERTTAYAGASNCAMQMTISLEPNASVAPFEVVTVNWTVAADFSHPDAINNTQLYYGPDSTGRAAQIVHSNVHSCVYGTGCDPFNDGKELVDKTVNKIANFSDNVATFTDSIQFPTPGEYSVLAHIILPDFDASSRFDYAVYFKVSVVATAPTTAPVVATPEPTTAAPAPVVETSSSSGGLSQEATIGIIVGVVVVAVAVVVAVIVVRRRNKSNSAYMPAPVQDGDVPNKMQQSAVTMTNSTTGFESAWPGPPSDYHQRPTNMSLDNTNHSSASSGHAYAAPSIAMSEERNPPPPYMGPPGQQEYFTASNASSVARKKRIDSDVEL